MHLKDNTMIKKEDYFKTNNRVLTRSRLTDYIKCPNFFYRKHITGEIKKEEKKAFAIGSAVDELLTTMSNMDKYVVISGDGRTKEVKEQRQLAEEAGLIVLSEDDYNTILGLANAIEATTAWQDLKKKGEFQALVAMDIKIGEHFDHLAGLPDHLLIEGDTCFISDLKTSMTIDKNKYYYHCKEYGYFLQAALYRFIIGVNHPEIKKFVNQHIVVEKAKDLWRVQCFELPQEEVDKAMAIIKETIVAIENDKDFKKKDATWGDSILLKPYEKEEEF